MLFHHKAILSVLLAATATESFSVLPSAPRASKTAVYSESIESTVDGILKKVRRPSVIVFVWRVCLDGACSRSFLSFAHTLFPL